MRLGGREGGIFDLGNLSGPGAFRVPNGGRLETGLIATLFPGLWSEISGKVLLSATYGHVAA